jgi:uncharacterized damage-inducible protein DinB
VADRKPPRLAAGERETLLALLRYQRESVVRKVEDLDDDAASGSPVASGTSLAWLVAHLANAESVWVEQRFAGGASRAPGTEATRTLAAAVDAYRRGWARVDAIVAAAELDDLCLGDTATPPVNLRWVLAHLLEETARHAGHADVLRELHDGLVGR